MFGKFVPALCLAVLAGLFLLFPLLRAVEIDGELQDLLRAKSRTDRVPVLMILTTPPTWMNCGLSWTGLSHQQRRKLVVDNLRFESRQLPRRPPWNFFAVPPTPTRCGRVQTLYLASALAFEAAPRGDRSHGAIA